MITQIVVCKENKELQEPIGTRKADFVVEGKVLVELKAKDDTDVEHEEHVDPLK